MKTTLTADAVSLPGIPIRHFFLLSPVVAAAVFVSILFFTIPRPLFLPILGLIAAYLLPPAGKETVIPVGIALGIAWWYMALAIVAVDAIAGLFMALNFDVAYRIPLLGARLGDSRKGCSSSFTTPAGLPPSGSSASS